MTVLREAFDYPFSRLDPTSAHIDPPSVALYETAVAKGPDGRGHPLLAHAWEVGPDGLEWTVRLRPDLRFHSGARCDAAAVLAAYAHLREESFEGRQLWYWDPVARVVADDALTLRFTLHHPYARLPALLWGTHTAVYREAGRRADPERFGYAVADGTGPFRLRSWSEERVVAERWPGYRPPASGFLGGRRGAVERIEWTAIVDEGERLAALERGDVDCLHGPPLDEVGRLQDDPRFVVTAHPQPSGFYLALDWRRTELGFDDVRVRRAVSLALDRGALVARALHGRGTPTVGPVPPGDEFHDPGIEQRASGGGPELAGARSAAGPDLAGAGARSAAGPDLAAARALLDAAGWTQPAADAPRVRDGRELAFALVTQDDAVFRRVVEQVRRQLVPLGVRVEPRFARPFADFYAACAAGPPATLSKWLWQDPVDAIIGFSSSSTAPMPNWQHAAAPPLDAAYAAWLRAGTAEQLRAAAAVVQRRFVEQLPYIPLATPDDVFVHRTGVHGWTPYRSTLYPYYQGVVVDGDDDDGRGQAIP